MNLSPAHEHELYEESAIARDIASERGYETVGKKEVPEMFGTSQRAAGLLFPLHNVYGETGGYQLKRNEPREMRGRILKYETPSGSSAMLDVHPRCLPFIGDTAAPLWITEGVKKADSAISAGLPCVIDISGVYNWRGKNKNGDATALGEWEMIALKRADHARDVVLAFDSDIRTNVNVQKAVKRLKRFLESKGAAVKVLVLPDLPDGSKCGLDDWFANGGTLEDLREHVQDDVPAPVVEAGDQAPFSDETYRAKSNGFYRATVDDEGNERLVRMTDFTAWIVAQTIHPERSELNYAEVVLRNARGQIQGPYRVSDSSFRQVDGRNGWLGMFGSSPRVYAGVTNAHLVNAIQVASGEVPLVTVYDRLGWMQDAEGNWWYLTSAGAVGAHELDTSIRVEPGGRLDEYQMQDAADTEAVKNAVRHVLEIPSVAQTDQGTAAVVTVMASMLRSLMIPARRQNFTTTIVGETGSGKSAVAGLLLQMFGPAFGYDHLTDNWGSTLNSLLDNASRARHAPLVIDDYVEIDTGTAGIGRQAHSRDTLIRLVANSAPRNRLKADTTRNDGAEPETGLISTQETTGSFRHASEAARQLFVRLEKRGDDGADISIEAIKQRSRLYGRTGTYNLAISGYVKSMAAGINALKERVDSMHDKATDTLSDRTKGLGLHEPTMNEQMNTTRAALADVKIAIYKDEARLDGMQQALGDALAAARVGERGAQKKASSLSMDVGKLNSSLDSLRSEERALERRLAQLEDDNDASEAEAARERIRALKQRTEEAENEFAALLDQAWDVGRELLQLERRWNSEQHRNGFVMAEEMPSPPKSPTRLANSTWYTGDQDTHIIDRWKNPVAPRTGAPRQRQPHDPVNRSPVNLPRSNGRMVVQGDRAFTVYEDVS